MRAATLVVVGDALLDRDVEGTVTRVCPDAPAPVLDEVETRSRPGGAALAAALAAAEGHDVTLVGALGDDPAGDELLSLLQRVGVQFVGLRSGSTSEKVRFLAGGRPLLRLDRGGRPSGPAPDLPAPALEAVSGASAVLVADYGGGIAALEGLRARLAGRHQPTVWDPHPRGADPVPGVTVATPNRAELVHFAGIAGHRYGPDGRPLPASLAARGLRRSWNVGALSVTLGPEGALLVQGDGAPLVVPAVPAEGDTCGAGDRFASTLAGALARRRLLTEAVEEAVAAASRFVAAGGVQGWGRALTGRPDAATGPHRTTPSADGPEPANPFELARAVRDRGGRVVVAGGCFDLLHAGHAALLQGARRLGDCLIIALNSDASVRRLKGSDRPVVPESDRAAMLRALGCVDAVALFDEDTPETLLRRLQPHLFVKGGDYSDHPLPEERVLAEWGGEAVLLPYLSGRSTTGLLRLVRAAG